MRRAPVGRRAAIDHARSGQTGLTLVEIMIALALGLLIMTGSGAMMLGQLNEHRRLLAQARVQQDLQLVMDLVVRSHRQRGYVDTSGPNITEWRLSAGVIQMKWDGGNWQSVTDADMVTVDSLSLASTATLTDLSAACPAPMACAAGHCPQATSTLIEVTVSAHAKADVRHKLQLRDAMALRNPTITGACT